MKSQDSRVLIAAVKALSRGRSFFGLRESHLAAEVEQNQAAGELGADAELRLTLRQLEVLRLMALGRITRQIASALHISGKTVEVHRLALMRKLNVRSTAEFIRAAARAGLVSLSF